MHERLRYRANKLLLWKSLLTRSTMTKGIQPAARTAWGIAIFSFLMRAWWWLAQATGNEGLSNGRSCINWPRYLAGVVVSVNFVFENFLIILIYPRNRNMEFSRPARRRRIKLDEGRKPEMYPHILQFYSLPPTENISLQEFEDLALDRVKGGP